MGRKRLELVGTTVGRLTVVSFSHYDGVPNAVQDEIVARVTGR